MNAMQWVDECKYIDSVVCKIVPLTSFNNDWECFKRYCTMQRDTATREGFHDSAQYIQHVLDDLS